MSVDADADNIESSVWYIWPDTTEFGGPEFGDPNTRFDLGEIASFDLGEIAPSELGYTRSATA